MREKEPIRVAQIMGKLWAGGVEAVVFNYYRQMDKNQIQFDYYYDSDSTVQPPQELIDMGARFFKLPPYQKLPIYLKTLKKYFKENKYKIVHSHINTLSIFPLFVAWLEHIPVRIAHNHSVPGGNEFKRNILKQILRCFAKVFSTDYFACSEKAGRWMFGDKCFDEGKVFIVKNAIDFARFQTIEEKDKLGISNKFIVGHVGRFTYAKNHKLLIDIFEEICRLRNDALLMLVGGGELYDDIVNRIREKGLEKKVLLIGQVINPEKYYGLANVIVMPSFFEGLSLTVIESQIAGIPVVMSDAIPEEAVISNACRYLKISNSPKKWAEMAIKISGIHVQLNDSAEDYNIVKKSKILMEWYLNHS